MIPTTPTARPLTATDIESLRRLAFESTESIWFAPSEVRGLIATLDVARQEAADAERARWEPVLLSAAADAHGLAAVYMPDAGLTAFGVIEGKAGLTHHSREFYECRVPICVERRALLDPRSDKEPT